jgi:PAS domain S-box-containing protein
MTQAHKASVKAAEKDTTSNGSEDASRGVAEELAALRAIVEGTAHTTGEEFFQTLVRHLAKAVDAHYAFVAEFASPETTTKARTIAFWARDRVAENLEWTLAGTPCEDVVHGKLCHHPLGVRQSFPSDRTLVDWGIESYLGVPLCDPEGKVLGHLAVFDERPMPEEPRKLLVFRIFAARAAAELARLHLEWELRESEERLRDLYEEAPIAYVKEDLQSRFISANRAAVRILGITPEDVPGMVGMSLVPDTPEAQRRVKEAFATIGRGTDTSGVVLELRRKDNRKPIWVEWWSKPEPGGKYTRTMFVDITDRMLMEQEKARLTAENAYLQEEIKSVHNFDEIVGRSPALLAVLDKVGRVAPTDATVLISGETGTGKELIARAIHSHSRRRDKPLIKLNCAALPAGLVESELFGHEKGAFTGAIARRQGRFELADGGTIFLDEIGELPADTQAKLLRVLQEQEFDRVGGKSPMRVDVRVIAATNRDLLEAVREKAFREDLYYRLSVFPIPLPPLRERPEDIPLLATYLLERLAARIGRRFVGIEPTTLQRLTTYSWPGNIRELQNVMERAVILATGSALKVDPDVLERSGSEPANKASAALNDVQREHILNVLRETKWVIEGPRGAAAVLGLHPNTLRSRLKKLGLSRSTHEGRA